MSTPNVVAVLDALLREEYMSIVPRLLESNVFVAPGEVSDSELVRRMAASNREHVSVLIHAILDRGATPAPRAFAVESGDLHFQGFNLALVRLRDDLKRLTGKYRTAIDQLAGAPEVVGLATEILGRHQQDLDEVTSRLNEPAVAG